jgi:hypothetical protein
VRVACSATLGADPLRVEPVTRVERATCRLQGGLSRRKSACPPDAISPIHLHRGWPWAYKARLAAMPPSAEKCRFDCGIPVGWSPQAGPVGFLWGRDQCLEAALAAPFAPGRRAGGRRRRGPQRRLTDALAAGLLRCRAIRRAAEIAGEDLPGSYRPGSRASKTRR